MIPLQSLNRRQFIRTGTAAAALLALGRLSPVRAAGGELNFLVVGDWGGGNEAQHKVASAMAEVAGRSRCDFIVSTGDNFYPRGVTNAFDPQWKEKFEDVYSAPALQVPWYGVLGNHDHRGDDLAEIEYSTVNPRWRMPARYFKRTERLADGSEVDFFFTDTNAIVRAYRNWFRFAYFPAGEQIAWLERELAASKAAWKIVVGHHPVYSGGEHGNSAALIEQFMPLFIKYGVQAYLNGHNHDLEHVVADGVHYLTSGGGSAETAVRTIDGTRFSRSTLGFIGARLTADELAVEFFDADADSLYKAAIPRNADAARDHAARKPERLARQRFGGTLSPAANLG
jgi:acid phosphatase